MGKARTEQYLAYLNGENVTIPEPFTVQDKYLYNLCKKGIGGGGNVEVDPSLTQAGKAADAKAVYLTMCYLSKKKVKNERI